jgi:hypothetical protein
MSVLDFIKSITSNRESGRLEINASGTHGASSGTRGTLLFHQGKLVDARLGSLSGFQAVNAAVALRDAEVSFDHVVPASHVSTITPSERIVLSRFFGIEAADMEPAKDAREPEIDWNPAPEPVVPLAEAGTVPFTFFSHPRIAVAFIALLLGVAVGAVALRSKVRALRQSAVVASAVESQPSSGSDAQKTVPPSAAEDLQQRAEQDVKQAADASPAAIASEEPVSVSSQPASEQPNSAPRSESSSPAIPPTQQDSTDHNANVADGDADVTDRDANVTDRNTNAADRAANVQDLTGQWRIINTVEKTAYRSFDNMEVGFRLTINQNGNEFTAKGVKFSENGQTLPAARRTPIELKGSIQGDKVVATFIEDGRARRTNGRFIWKLQNGRDGLAGTFVSNAANSSGRSAVTKEQ